MSNAAESRGTMIALVTGGTAGIGEQIAVKLRAAGLTVFITGRERSRGESVANDLGATLSLIHI